jgi:hypothetical protein
MANRRSEEVGIGDRGQRHEPDAVGERLDQLGTDLQSEPCLSGAARSCQRHDADTLLLDQRARRGDLCLATEERGRLGGKVVQMAIEALEGWELGDQTRSA